MYARITFLLAAAISTVTSTGLLNLGPAGHGLSLGSAGQGSNGLGGGPGVVIGHVAEQVVSSVPVVQTRVEPYDHYPVYGYSYTVHDTHTGDSKHQFETRHGDSVRGQYSLAEADGSRRTVEYASEPHTGFSAIVHRTSPQGR